MNFKNEALAALPRVSGFVKSMDLDFLAIFAAL
jgi:hypothetical protein